MHHFNRLWQALQDTPLQGWQSQLSDDIAAAVDVRRHAALLDWQRMIDALPKLKPSDIELNDCMRVGLNLDCSNVQQQSIEASLQQLHPWRKGPIDLYGIHINTEWRSDWKWGRVRQHISSLSGRTVLDVGCGNGYYGFRMAGAGAKLVIGVDPMLLFLMQFRALSHFVGEHNVHQIPLAFDSLPTDSGAFDTVFSMGVLYHRRSPIDHLFKLRGHLRSGGELVLETLVVDGDEQYMFMPSERYAKMRNVWFIPSCLMLERWLSRCGFKDIACVNVSTTSVEEQRSTAWMRFESLGSFLDSEDHTRSIEGYPAPKRATFIASIP
ncbi:MAG: tRNA 5-methoxyuridine(34)/uridine 5-oxyacetic acid(34) synthase CmoB [Mariprofundaceae bacterium]